MNHQNLHCHPGPVVVLVERAHYLLGFVIKASVLCFTFDELDNVLALVSVVLLDFGTDGLKVSIWLIAIIDKNFTGRHFTSVRLGLN